MSDETTKDKNIISFLGIIGIGLTTVIGSGIWKDPLIWSSKAGILALVAVFIGWLLMFTAGLAYAECVAMFPQSGGPYSYVGGAINKKLGTVVGITYYIGYVIIGTILAFITANFTLKMIDYTKPWAYYVLTIAIIIVLGAIAGILPLRVLGNVAFYWVALKILLIIITAIVLIAKGDVANYSLSGLTASGFQDATQSALWALLGFDVMLVFAAEVSKKDTKKITGKKKMPLSILIALGIILVVYLIFAIGGSSIVSIGSFDPENQISFEVMSEATNIPSWVLYSFGIISAAGTTFAIFATLTHQLKVIAEGGSLPKVFAKEKNGIYYVNILTSLVVAIALAIAMLAILFKIDPLYVTRSGTKIDIVTLCANIGLTLVLLVAMLPAGLIALYLRIKMPILERPFKVPLHFITFPLAIILSLYLIYLNIAVLII